MPYTTLQDVEIEFGAVTSADAARVEALIDRAESYLRAEVRDLDARVAASRTDSGRIALVVSELVASALRNPQGLKSFAHTEGPFTTSGTYGEGGPSAGLTARHRRLLGDVPDRGAWTVMPGRSG